MFKRFNSGICVTRDFTRNKGKVTVTYLITLMIDSNNAYTDSVKADSIIAGDKPNEELREVLTKAIGRIPAEIVHRSFVEEKIKASLQELGDD